jgi:hypothetical protein
MGGFGLDVLGITTEIRKQRSWITDLRSQIRDQGKALDEAIA